MNNDDFDIDKKEVSLFEFSPKEVVSTQNKVEKHIKLTSKEEIEKEITKIWKKNVGKRDKKKLLISFLKETLNSTKDEIKTQFFKGEITGMEVIHANTLFIDDLINALMDFGIKNIIKEKTKPLDMAVLAVGGYGRRELSPYSDIDILFLLPKNPLKVHEKLTEFLLYLFWDLGLKVGQSFSTIEQAIIDGKEDFMTLTNLLEARFVWGSTHLFENFVVEYRKELIEENEENFVIAKLKERTKRYKKHKQSRYLLEPDVKEGRGGLRDLHLIFWFAKFLYNVLDINELAKIGVISKQSAETFIKAHGFLSAVRCYIHFVSKNSSNILTFDIQPEIAKLMGYCDTNSSVAVEKFMKAYYLHAKLVGDLVRIICAFLEETKTKKSLNPIHPKLEGKKEVRGFKITNNRLNFIKDLQITQKPTEIIRIFRVAQKYNLDIHPKALQEINRNLSLVKFLEDDDLANQYFLEILLSKSNPKRILRLMSESGVLGLFIPDFGFVIAQMQFDMYHIYTTDEHTLNAVGILHSMEYYKEVELDEYKELPDLDFIKETISKISNKKLLYLSLLFHDIGKGRGGDHSQKGAEIATSLAPRFKLSSQETSDLSWLVLYHQTMSQTAFQRDVYDPKTIEDFSKLVKTKQRLYMLFALTCADILAVGPNVWSEWKKSLLIELFKRTLKKITGAQEEEKQTIKEKKKQIQESLKNDISRDVLDNILNIGSHNYWLSFNIETIKSHVKNLFNKEKKDDWIYFYFNDDEKKNITELTVYTKDYSGVFSKIAGALSISNASIIDAKIITLKDKTILDSFYIQESKNNKIGNVKNFDKFISSKKKKQNIIENITNAVFNKLDLEEKISKKLANNKQRIRKISEKPNVKIDNKGSKDHSLLEIGADDKIGLLYSITSIISSLGLQISSAQISTYGTRAYDVFYIKDKSGMKITDKKQIDIIKTRITENL